MKMHSKTHITDNDLLDALLMPERQQDFPRESRAFVRIDTSLRVYWHTLFDICPELLTLSGPDGLAIFRPFMQWAAQQQLSMNWTYYLWVLHWLHQSPFAEQVNDEITHSLIGASAARWATADRGSDCGIVLQHTGHTDLIVGWKCHSVQGSREVERIELETPLPPPTERVAYFTLPDFELTHFPGWSAIPR